MIRNDRSIFSRLALIACLAGTALAPATADARSFTVGQAVVKLSGATVSVNNGALEVT